MKQETGKTVASLESVGAPQATVIRHSGLSSEPQTRVISVENVFPGDIVLLRNGDIVPDDARIIEGHCSSLECDEAFLTGTRSVSVLFWSSGLRDQARFYRSRSILTLSTRKTARSAMGRASCLLDLKSPKDKGRAHAVIFSTGMKTEIGKIASALLSKAVKSDKGWKAIW